MPTVRGGWLESPPSKPRAWSFLDTHILPFQRGKSGQSFRADRLTPVSARGSDTSDHDVRTGTASRDCGRVQSGSIVEKLALRARREASADDDSGANLISCRARSWRCIGKTPSLDLSVLSGASGPLSPR